MKIISVILVLWVSIGSALGATPEAGSFGDQGDGTYINPILPGDFQNTDVIRVGGDYYYITATKAMSPGMMVLHSKDLVNWTIIGHVIPDITVLGRRYSYDRMEGETRGVWAGAIAFHDKKFFVYFTTPDEGIYVSTAANPAGPWEPLTCLMKASGWDDPCPLWDGDGQAYLITTNFARDAKTGKAYNVHLFKMTADGKTLQTDADTIIHQSQGSEANKLFKKNGFYYHFFSEVTKEGRIPMIGRAKSISGPYENRQLNHVNRPTDREPNQGTILQTEAANWVFITHHGFSEWEGRPASLLPIAWNDDWPAAGKIGLDGIGNMIWDAKKPVDGFPVVTPQTDDDFKGLTLSPQWEWYFQPRAEMWSLSERPGFLRLHAFKPLAPGNPLKAGNILTQRPLRAKDNLVSIRMDVAHLADGQLAGLGLLGRKYAAVAVSREHEKRSFVFTDTGKMTEGPELPEKTDIVWLGAAWDPAGNATFQFSTDGKAYSRLGQPFRITNFGAFLGAKIGIFTFNDLAEAGYVDVDEFRYTYTHAPAH